MILESHDFSRGSMSRRVLKCEDIYARYSDFKRRVILMPQKELKKYSDIYFEFREIKTGRSVTALKFYIKTNTKNIEASTKNQLAVTAEEEPSEEIDKDVADKAELLVAEGIAGPKAITLGAKYSMERILENIEYTNKNSPDNPGYLVTAIEQDYAGAADKAKEVKEQEKTKKGNDLEDKYKDIYIS
ncbi:MAG: replication initiation protein [Clostridia bacterium]|nr:replication initiation protein [Clostridia bacterium]